MVPATIIYLGKKIMFFLLHATTTVSNREHIKIHRDSTWYRNARESCEEKRNILKKRFQYNNIMMMQYFFLD
jgi:hypothetical protein